MAPINYAGRPWIRPAGTGSPPLPLILRNPQNDAAKFDQEGDGPAPGRLIAPNDYRMYFEGFKAGVNGIGYATSPNGYAWAKDYGNIIVANASPNWEKDEVAPDDWFYNPYAGEWWMYYHGGNNGAGDRKIGLMTSPTGAPGTWTRYAGNPILLPGTAGAWDDNFVADCVVFILAANDYRMLYYGAPQSGTSGVGYATSTDGKSWTKYPSNPVMAASSGNDVNGLLSPWGYRDANGRIHLWFSGFDSGFTERILYAYSDDFITWTRNQADVIDAPSGVSTDPDVGIGNVVKGWHDAGILWFSQENFNFASYGGDALGRLDGRGLYWIPEQAVTTPGVPGRAYVTNSDISAVNTGGSLLNSNIATIWSTFRCPPGNSFRHIYAEVSDFNRLIFIRVMDNGKLNVWWRTPSEAMFSEMISSGSTRYDDNKEHRVMLVRRAAADFELYVDGVSVATDTVNKGTDATVPASVSWGTNGGSEPLFGILRQSLTIKGRALTTGEENTLFTNGTLPGGVTATCWVKHGSGGAAGPDTAVSGATYGTTISATTLVEVQRLVALTPSGSITPTAAIPEITASINSLQGTVTPTTTLTAQKLTATYQLSLGGTLVPTAVLNVVRIGGVVTKSIAGTVTPTSVLFTVKNPAAGGSSSFTLRFLQPRTD